jgi:hypothetical protein
VTADFPTSGTGNTAIATASKAVIHGVSPGTTNHYATSEPMYWGLKEYYPTCPTMQKTATAPTNVGPYMVEPIATDFQGPANCTTKGWAGWVRNVTNQVQYANGAPYAVSGLTVADIISVGTPNSLGIANQQEGHTPTTGDGSFPDTYYVCSSACPGNGVSDALQNWTVAPLPLPHANALVYACSSIKIDGN